MKNQAETLATRATCLLEFFFRAQNASKLHRKAYSHYEFTPHLFVSVNVMG